MRLFAALDLSRETQDAMAAEQRRIKASLGSAAAPLKWVRPDAAHLTLVFIGDVDAARAPDLVEAMGRDVGAPAFDVVFEGLGVFPPRGAPRVLWLGITSGGPQLAALQRELASRIAAHGIALEARAFHPHLTIGRWTSSRPSDRERAIGASRHAPIARQHVAWATLYESRLLPSGAVHTALARANLTST